MIDQWLNKIDQLSPYCLFWSIVGSSILIAAWMQYIQHGWINPDSVLYFEQARLFSQGNWSTGFNVFQWPLYGACIALVHKLSTLPIQPSAQLLNMLFFGIATASFLQLIKLAGGNNRTWLMAALLLFSSQYIAGDVLEMLMRDQGFWAFYLMSLVFFIRYAQQEKWSDALLWQLCIIIATLFRIEAILFLLFLPLANLLHQQTTLKHKCLHLLNTYAISLFIGIIIALILITHPHLNISSFGRLDEVFASNLYQQFTQKLFTQADIMSQQVLGRYLDEFAIPGLLLTFLFVMVSKTVTATGLIGTGLAAFGFKQSSTQLQPIANRILITVSIIAVISMALIITKVFVLSSRYVVSFAWVLLIYASFYLAALSTQQSKRARAIFIIICTILSLGFVKNILPKGNGYNYDQDAITWIKKHHQHATIFYEDARLRYYANAPFIRIGTFNWEDLTSSKQTSSPQYDFLVIKFSKRDNKKRELIKQSLSNYKEIKRFYARKKKKYCAIYQNTSQHHF